jgi:hypothetical protein
LLTNDPNADKWSHLLTHGPTGGTTADSPATAGSNTSHHVGTGHLMWVVGDGPLTHSSINTTDTWPPLPPPSLAHTHTHMRVSQPPLCTHPGVTCLGVPNLPTPCLKLPAVVAHVEPIH